jgi:adenylosuccinate lyase
MRAWKEGLDFRELIAGDTGIAQRLSAEEVQRCFDLQHHLRHVDKIFQRVFGE